MRCFALFGWENVKDAVEGARGVAGVERSQDKVPRFSRGAGELDRFQVPHLSHHDDVGILPQ